MRKQKILSVLIILIISLLTSLSFGADSTLNDDLVTCWTFDEETGSITPSIEGTYNGTVTNAVLNSDANCKADGCYYYDGSGDYITVSDDDQLELIDGNFTWIAWIDRDNSGNTDNILSKDDNSVQRSYYFRALNDNRFNTREQTSAQAFADGSVGSSWTLLIWSGNGNTDEWFHYNGGSKTTFASGTTTTTSSTQNLIFGKTPDANDYTGYIDEICKWNRPLTDTEASELWNSGDGSFYNNWSAQPIIATSQINMSIINLSGVDKRSFDEDENFNIFVNLTYSDNSTSIDDMECNITLENGITELSGTVDNFSLCTSGCDYTTYEEEFNLTQSNGDTVLKDYIHFDACHENLALADIDVTFQCADNSNSYIINPPELVTCDLGISSLLIEDSLNTCINNTLFNVSITTTGGNSRRKRIEDLHVDREYTLHTNVWNEEVFYNVSSELYYTIHTHKYFLHDSYDINATCINPTDSNLNNNIGEEITIVNSPPQIFFETMNNSLGTFDLINNSVYEYADGSWSWVGAIIDDDLDTFSVYWYNSTNEEIYSYIDVPSLNITQLDTPTQTFLLFGEGNPYTLYVNATDTNNATSELQIFFTINDTTPPELDIITPENLFLNTTNHIRGTDLNFDIDYSDEALFTTGFKLFLFNGTTIYESSTLHNPPITFYNLADTINNLNVSDSKIYGIANASDAHTKENVKDKLIAKILKSNDIIFNEDFELHFTDGKIKDFELIYLDDRVSIDITVKDKTYEYIELVMIPKHNNHHLIYSQKWGEYNIVNNYWIDYISDSVTNVDITSYNGGDYPIGVHYTVRLYLDGTTDKIKLNSIGILNYKEINFFINEIGVPVPEVCEITQTNVFYVALLYAIFLLFFFLFLKTGRAEILALSGLYLMSITVPIYSILCDVMQLFLSIMNVGLGFIMITYSAMFIFKVAKGRRGRKRGR